MAFDPSVSIRGHFHFAGDSITFQGWHLPLVSAINAVFPVPGNTQFPGRATGVAAASAGRSGMVTAVAYTPIAINQEGHGIPGATVADMEAGVVAYITSFSPIDYLWIEIGINDTSNGTLTAPFKTSYTNVLSAAIAANPNIKIWCMEMFTNGGPANAAGGELWQAGPPAAFAGSNPYNPRIATLNQAIQDVIATFPAASVTYVPVRAAVLSYEQLNNAPAPGAAGGILTQDGIHPNAAGQALMSAQAFAMVSVVP